jgi:hypothetical protein
MKKYLSASQCRLVLSGCVGVTAALSAARAEEGLTKIDSSESVWQVSASGNTLLNVSASFRGHPAYPSLSSPNDRPGAANYDNGYVGRDVSGDPNLSTYWGYTQASQQIISGGSVVGLNYERTSALADPSSPRAEADPSYGGEIALRRQIKRWGDVRFGLEFGASYNKVDVKDSGDYFSGAQRTDVAYGFPAPVSTALFPPPGYSGPFNGAGLVINPTPTTGPTVAVPGATLVGGSREVEADVFGLRLGPYFDLPVTEKISFTFSTGLLVAVVHDDVTWSETLAVGSATAPGYWTGASSRSGDSTGVTAGIYVGGGLNFHLTDSWSLIAGVRFQDAGTYQHDIGNGQMDLNLGQAISANLGVGYSF